MDATSLNSAMQQACGDNKSSFALVCMHSVVATNLENLKLLTYLKYTDANGMEREIGLAKGRTNLKQTLLAFESLMNAKNRCTEEISELRDKYSPNRAQRRANKGNPQVRYPNHKKGGNHK